ncbi:MAG: CbtB-domain containing protein [Ilumatobacteraceae bacterium]|nr:CbtB-domain containing protein [Ilumatobacteraceae bacterium]MCU1389099.1 CbtB-domain containing protein [Ilumatobacteraceae bacterium]
MSTMSVALRESTPISIKIPVRELMPWALFTGVLMLFLMYIVGAEQGASSILGGHMLHEWVHDARHLLGFPCH